MLDAMKKNMPDNTIDSRLICVREPSYADHRVMADVVAIPMCMAKI